MKLKIAVVLLVASAVSASDALAANHYGGSAVRSGARLSLPVISIIQHDDGRITGRLGYSLGCRRGNFVNLVTRIRGRWNGTTFTASGRTRPGRIGTLRFTLTGSFAPGAAGGKVRLRGCRSYTREFSLRTPSIPAGAPVQPARDVAVFGVTSQSLSGVHMPIALRIAGNGRLYGSWSSTMRCGTRTLTWENSTPPATVRADGTFTRNETFSVRYRGGGVERYRVNFSGRFLADGVTGTLRVRMRYREGRNRNFEPCDSGIVTWGARA